MSTNHPRNRPLFWCRLALLVAIGISAVLTGPIAFAAAQGIPFTVRPLAGSQTDPTGSYFTVAAAAGTTFEQSLELHNPSAQPLEVYLKAVDANTAAFGGASYGLRADVPKITGTWVTLENETLTLSPSARATVDFRVSIPDDARSGVHLAGLAVGVLMDSDSGRESAVPSGQAGAGVDVHTRRTIALQVTVPGPSDPELVITGVSPIVRPDGLYLAIDIENTGRGLTEATGTIELPDRAFSHDFAVATFVPGTAIAYPVKWSTAKEDGTHAAEVTLHYGSKTARWSGTFKVGETVRQEQEDRQVAQQVPDTTDRFPSSFTVIVVAAMVIGVAFATTMRLRQNRRGRARDPFGGGS